AFDLFFLYSLILLTSFPILPPPSPPSPLFPYTTLFRSIHVTLRAGSGGELPSPGRAGQQLPHLPHEHPRIGEQAEGGDPQHRPRSEEHTSELQSRFDLVCRLLLEKKKKDTVMTGSALVD